uniref:Putative photosystem I reaction center subunit N n=1 Tax=Galdieria sulphuraria TaxID=130081 RepID=E3UIV1_GALSU|nr:putative photosystem I reaction center subunit N [Galdieria sulphuraria]
MAPRSSKTGKEEIMNKTRASGNPNFRSLATSCNPKCWFEEDFTGWVLLRVLGRSRSRGAVLTWQILPSLVSNVSNEEDKVKLAESKELAALECLTREVANTACEGKGKHILVATNHSDKRVLASLRDCLEHAEQ